MSTRKLGTRGFAAEISRAVDRAKGNIDHAVQALVLKLDRKCVEGSPVGNPDEWTVPPPPGYVGGRFKGNWQIGVNAKPIGTLSTIDPSGTATLARALADLQAGKGGDTFWIINNLPYARRLEYDQWSRQAPAGIVGPALVTFKALLRESVQEARARK